MMGHRVIESVLRYLRPALGTMLIFIGVKMMLFDMLNVPPPLSLALVTMILGSAVATSLMANRRLTRAAPQPGPSVQAVNACGPLSVLVSSMTDRNINSTSR